MDTRNPVKRLDLSIAVCGANAVKATRGLLEQGHWEIAVAPSRQLFELLVNAEHLNAQPDREAAAFRYANFGLLRAVQAERKRLAYESNTARPTDENRDVVLERLPADRISRIPPDEDRRRPALAW